MYGLPQAGRIAHDNLKKHLAKSNYAPCTHTSGLWKHTTNDICFTLWVDDFLVKYTNRKDAALGTATPATHAATASVRQPIRNSRGSSMRNGFCGTMPCMARATQLRSMRWGSLPISHCVCELGFHQIVRSRRRNVCWKKVWRLDRHPEYQGQR